MIKICVIRLSSLGDTILVTPVLRELKTRLHDVHLSLITKEEYAPLFEHSPYIDHILPFDSGGRHRGMAGLRRFIAEHQGETCQYLIDLHRNLRSRAISAGMKAERRISYRNNRWQRMAMVYAKWLSASSRHTVDLYFDCLAGLGIEPVDKKPEVFLTDDELTEARNLLVALNPACGKGWVGIHVGARSRVKQWFPDRVACVADRLSGEGWLPVLLGSEGDRTVLDEVRTAAQRHFDTVVPGSLRQLAAVIDQCSLLICHDSGPMHLAVARRVPVVALFGPTHPKLGFWPLGKNDTVVTAEVSCSPCSLHGTRPCRKTHRECMEGITPDMVIDKALHILESRGSY